MKTIENIIVHCSDSNFGNSALITTWHLQRGWSLIGYHYVILNGQIGSGIYHSSFDGHVETGRPLNEDNALQSNEVGAHALGYNSNSIGICLIGKSTFTEKQYQALAELIRYFKDKQPNIKVMGHCEVEPQKTCPNFNVSQFMQRFKL